MPRPLAPLTQAALKLVAKGWPPYRAALKVGANPTTIYVAIARARKRLEGALEAQRAGSKAPPGQRIRKS